MPSTMTTDFDEDGLVEKKEEEDLVGKAIGVRLALENRREIIILFL